MARRRIPPMPIEDLAHHPIRMAMPSAARGMLDTLIFHFWLTECRPLPKDYNTLMSLAHAHKPTWIRHHNEIMQVFNELAPDLERWRDWREASLAPLKASTAARHARHRIHKSTTGESVVAPRLGAQSRQKRAESRLNALESIAADVDKRFAD